MLGVVARLWPRRALWLDEAQSVAIASEAITAIPGVLRTDGAPPAYYLLLHGWMALFGDSDVAVRSLSVILSLITLAVLAVAMRRMAGIGAAVAVTVLLATSPFVIRYATEGRMYALVMLEVVVGLVALDACLRRPTVARAIAVAAVTALALYTHYWSIYLVAAVGIVLAVAARRPGPARVGLAAVAAGAVLWLPWVPTFLFQSERTATPWAEPARPAALVAVFDDGVRGWGALPVVLSITMAALVLLGIWRGSTLLRRPISAWALGAVLVLTLLTALAGATLSDSAFVSRYTSVAVPLMITLAALGVATLPRRLTAAILVVAGVIGLLVTTVEIGSPRTNSTAYIEPLRQQSAPDDVLIYCPDQLGPAASRLLEQAGVGEFRQYVFPSQRAPGRVDWIDYADRHTTADPRAFVRALETVAPPSTIWLVFSGSYPPTQRACRALFNALSQAWPERRRLVEEDFALDERGSLWRFDR